MNNSDDDSDINYQNSLCRSSTSHDAHIGASPKWLISLPYLPNLSEDSDYLIYQQWLMTSIFYLATSAVSAAGISDQVEEVWLSIKQHFQVYYNHNYATLYLNILSIS